MNPVLIRCSMCLLLAVFCLPSFAEREPEYGDIIKRTPEYKTITTPREDNGVDPDPHYHPYYYPYPPYHPPYGPAPAYHRPAAAEGVGLSGFIHLGVSIGKSEFDYDDIEDGDASLFHIGYRPEDSRLGYELSFFDSGTAEVTSLSAIDIEVESLNFVLSLNSSRNAESRLNLFGKGGIYFAKTILAGPFDRVRENSNGFLIATGIDFSLNRHFGLKAEAYRLFDVEDFADDRSLTFFNLGGQFYF